MNIKAAQSLKEPQRFGTFAGVFTPSVLTILGVIMFLRFPVVVGYGGLKGALLILVVAQLITFATGLSLSSISTNMRVRGGGAYYLISRSLGVEFGGMIAVFFYGAQALAVSIYVFGFTEAVFSAFPGLNISFLAAATLTNIIVLICVYIGAGWTIKVQYGVLAILALSIISFWSGAIPLASLQTLRANFSPAFGENHNFFNLFALFFPAVTGIMAGVNMSGDLKEPSKAIPRGTLLAIGLTAFIYISFALLLAASSNRDFLLNGEFVIRDIASSSGLIYAGVICATLSSALGSMMGAPRVLQAFSRDNIFTRIKWLGRGSGVSAEPRRAIILTFIIAQAGIMTGGLDNIAPVITMFFLITYGTVNLACFYESISRNPSFRPTFRFNHWSIALFGALACLSVMFMINPFWALVAISLSALMYFLIARAEILVQWGNLRSGMTFQKARHALLKLEQEKYHPKNWRPSILVLSGGSWNRLNLLKYACLLSANRGVVSLAQIITGDLNDCFKRQIEAEKTMRRFIREERLEAFPVVVADENFEGALKSLIQCHGIGGLKPNTVLLGWSDDARKNGALSITLNLAKKMKRSLLILKCRHDDERWYFPGGAINIWWNNPNSAPLMLLMAFLLHENSQWRDCNLRILRTVGLEADKENITAEMKEMLVEARIDAEIIVLAADDPLKAVREAMMPSGVLFAGFEPAEHDPAEILVSSLQEVIDLPGDVALVYNAGDASLGA